MLFKVSGKIILQQNNKFLNDQLILFPIQYGFRSNYSTSHAILDITSTCYENIENKLFIGLVLLDFAKAFDSVDNNFLLQKLDHYMVLGAC